MNPAGRPLTPSFTPQLPPADLGGQPLTTDAITQAPLQEQEGEELQVVMLEVSEQELAQLREENPELARQLEEAQALAQNPELAQPQAPGANRYALSAASATSLKALGTTTLLLLVPVVKNAAKDTVAPNAAAYLVAAFAGQGVGAVLSKILPEGTQEYTVAPRHAESMKLTKALVTIAAYTGSISAATKLTGVLSGSALFGTGVAISGLVGQAVNHGPFLVEHYVRGHDVSTRPLTRSGTMATVLNLVVSALIGGTAGGIMDGSEAIKASAPNSTFDGAPGEAMPYVTILLAVTFFAVASATLPPLLQRLLSSRTAAPAENNAPADPPVDLVTGQVGVQQGGVQLPVVEVPPPRVATHRDGTSPARRGDQDVSIV